MNTCEKCSSPVPEEKAFCPNCGAPMVTERERKTETPEGMGETMYEAPPPMPLRKPTGPLPPKPVKAAPSSKPPVAKTSASNAAVSGVDYPKFAKKETPAAAADSNKTLHLILRASVVLFVLTILVVAILYVMGKI